MKIHDLSWISMKICWRGVCSRLRLRGAVRFLLLAFGIRTALRLARKNYEFSWKFDEK